MMKTLLVVRGAEEEKLVRALVEAGAVEVFCAHDGQTAREAPSSGQYALAFLADGSAELAKELAACSRAGVLLPLAPERMGGVWAAGGLTLSLIMLYGVVCPV